MAMRSMTVQSNADWTWQFPGQKFPATPGIMPGKLQPQHGSAVQHGAEQQALCSSCQRPRKRKAP